MNTKGNIIEYDVVRTFALLLVLLGHCTYNMLMTDYGGVDIEVDSSTYCVMQKCLCFLTGVFYKFHMPLFMALSGSLWAVHLQKKGLPSFNSVWRGKSKRLLIPFLLTALFWSVPLKFISGYWDGAGDDMMRQIFVGQILMFGNSNSHLWFVQALFWIFILSWVIEKIGLRKRRITFMAGLFGVSICCVFINRKFHIEFLNILTALYYLFWFYFGFYFENYREQVNKYVSNHVSWLKCIVACFFYAILIFVAEHLVLISGFNSISVYLFAPLGMASTYALCYKSLTITPPVC